MNTTTTYDVIILGAGAAGLMCAIEAGKRGRSVVVLERNQKAGEKIRISGGGRCNFTNIITDHDNYLSQNPHFCKSALARFTPEDFVALVKKYAIPFHEKTLGQLFCDNSSREIIDMLLTECRNAGAEIRTGIQINGITKNEDFIVETNHGEISSHSLVVATGGLSIPPLGATDFGYRVAKQFGISVTETKPGLVPLTFKSKEQQQFKLLSGISLRAHVTCGKQQFTENILFTHRGLSGPAILQISSYWDQAGSIVLDLLPSIHMLDHFIKHRTSNIEFHTFLAQFLPKRFAQIWCEQYSPSKPLSQLSEQEAKAIEDTLHRWEFFPGGTEGFGKAEVTCGGIDTTELSSKTMEAGKVRGLYFIGEVVDVTGHLGGYNFQWAWASGFAAGQYA